MLKFLVKLKYKFKNYKRLLEFIRRISCNHRCNYGLYSVVSHGAWLAAAQPKMAAGSPTGRLTSSNGLHDYLFINVKKTTVYTHANADRCSHI